MDVTFMEGIKIDPMAFSRFQICFAGYWACREKTMSKDLLISYLSSFRSLVRLGRFWCQKSTLFGLNIPKLGFYFNWLALRLFFSNKLRLLRVINVPLYWTCQDRWVESPPSIWNTTNLEWNERSVFFPKTNRFKAPPCIEMPLHAMLNGKVLWPMIDAFRVLQVLWWKECSWLWLFFPLPRLEMVKNEGKWLTSSWWIRLEKTLFLAGFWLGKTSFGNSSWPALPS